MTTYIDIHTHRPRKDVLCIVSLSTRQWPGDNDNLFSAGVHPYEADRVDMDSALDYLTSAPAVAIGEIGLDYSCDVDRSIQESVFRKQLEIAATRGLPVIIHCVRAYNETLKILGDYALTGVIFHSYIGSPEQTEQVLRSGYYISAGPVSFRSPKTVDSLRSIPADRIFAETDDDEMGIEEVYEKLSSVRVTTVETLGSEIGNNYIKLFA